MTPAAMTEPAALAKTAKLLYRPLDFVMVRAPLLSVESYFDLAHEESQLVLLSDARVRRAVTAGSPSLAGAMERSAQAALTRRDADRMRAKLLRYQIRMATRPTPFGLFAGVALSDWGPSTDLQIRTTCAATRTRPDMAWLLNLVLPAEANPAVRRRLNLFANPLATVAAGRLWLTQGAPGTAGTGAPVSVRATAVVRQALALARQPIPYTELVDRLCDASPSATPEKVERLLNELWERTFLLTDLRPPLTHNSPAHYLHERLSRIPEAAGTFARLDTFLNAASAWDQLDPEAGAAGFAALLAAAGAPSDGSQQTPVQVDMAMSVTGRLADCVAGEAARAAELLLRLSLAPHGLSSLAAYRQTFVTRYGYDREVPVLELFDPQLGLGPPSAHGHFPVGPDPARAEQRAQTLFQLASTALHHHQPVVHLDDECLARLETWPPHAENAPVSLDLNFLVEAASPAAIDAGDFTLVVGPNLGAWAAGRNLGRFADLLAPEGAAALARAAAVEESQAPDHLWAELVYLPSQIRSANVVIRPQVRAYEIALGVSAGVPPSHVIPLEELVVGVENGRFYVRWSATGQHVRFSSGNMLNLSNAPPAGRFLVELGMDGKALFTSFDWGQAENFPYLPRVQSGRVVLRPAQWRIQKDALATQDAASWRTSLHRWRSDWDVPRYVCLSHGDNRLILDLEQDAQAAELKAEIQKLPAGGALVVQEVLPALDKLWLEGPGGHYYSEFIASLVLASEVRQDAPPRSVPPPQPAREATPPTRLHPPGSEWLFVKLYGPRNLEDALISGSLHTFAENAVSSGLADSWFYIRYTDPDTHLRLRFHGSPERLTSLLYPHICEWAAGLMSDGVCLRFVLDTYEQEIERFGGPAGMAAAEAIFATDSRCAAQLLRHLKVPSEQLDRNSLLAFTIDDLLAGLGFDGPERLRWYRSQKTAGTPDTGAEYREKKNLLRSVVGQPQQFFAALPGGAEALAALAERRGALTRIGDQLRAQPDLTRSLDVLCSSFVHLHVNRMAPMDTAAEQRVLSLLLRTRESLAKAPSTSSASSAVRRDKP